MSLSFSPDIYGAALNAALYPKRSSHDLYLTVTRRGNVGLAKNQLLARKADCSVRWLLNHTALTAWEHGFNGQLSYFDVAAMDSIEGRIP